VAVVAGAWGQASDGAVAASEPIISPALALALEWYARPAEQVAIDLLGCLLVTAIGGCVTAGWIVEAEAYGGPEDPASHASCRRNGLVQAMWGPPGHAYIYRAYGVFPCFNVVTGLPGEASAVLVRAIEPVVGVAEMARRRGVPAGPRIAAGPGKLGRALGLSIEQNGLPLDRPPVWIQPGRPVEQIDCGQRVGVRRGADRPWRFGIAGHPALSRPFLGVTLPHPAPVTK
jgi:DNA-3-methyladenine glycosylase